MEGGKHWIVYLAGIVLLSAIALSLVSEGHEDCQLKNRRKKDPNTNDQWRILCELSKKFASYRKDCQYGVLYLPPPDNPLLPTYKPEEPETIPKALPIFPALPEEKKSPFRHNYAVAIPQKKPESPKTQ